MQTAQTWKGTFPQLAQLAQLAQLRLEARFWASWATSNQFLVNKKYDIAQYMCFEKSDLRQVGQVGQVGQRMYPPLSVCAQIALFVGNLWATWARATH